MPKAATGAKLPPTTRLRCTVADRPWLSVTVRVMV
jgi:hypothetical protein